MVKKRKQTRRPSKPRVAKAGPKKVKSARPGASAREGEREMHYTDLRKVTLANALKRLR